MQTAERFAASANGEEGGAIDVDLEQNINLDHAFSLRVGRKYHMQDSLLDVTNSKLHDDANSFLVSSIIFLLNLLEKLSGVFLISSHLSTSSSLFGLWVSLDDAKTNDFVTIFHHIFDEPFESMLGIGVLVDGYEEDALVTSIGVAVVLAD